MNKSKTVKIPKYTDDAIAYHINALLSAVDHIDDLLAQTNGDITQQLLQEMPLQPLPSVAFSLTELHQRIRHLYKLTAEPVAKVAETRISAHFSNILQLFSRLLKDEYYCNWFLYRIDEVEGVPQYYDIIPCPMYFGAVAARIHATLLECDEDFLIEDRRDELFSQYNQKDYGSCFQQTVIKLDRRKRNLLETELKKGSLESYKKAGKDFYAALSEKPSAYKSGQEILRDILLVGLNCKIFNPVGPLNENGGKYLAEVKNLWIYQHLGSMWPAWADQVWDEKELYQKMKVWYMGGMVVATLPASSELEVAAQAQAQGQIYVQSVPLSTITSAQNRKAEKVQRITDRMSEQDFDMDVVINFMNERRIDQVVPISMYSDTDLDDLYKLILG